MTSIVDSDEAQGYCGFVRTLGFMFTQRLKRIFLYTGFAPWWYWRWCWLSFWVLQGLGYKNTFTKL